MIKWIYNSFYIKGHEILFYSFIILIISIIILTIYLVNKELKDVNK